MQPQDVSARDLRVRELQREMEKKEAVRSTGPISPRSKTLIAGLSAVLEPYNYGEAEIHRLIKRCGHDESRIQAAVSDILEDKRGHEHEEWSTTATASEKKIRAMEAKERRLQREREQAEEAERQRVQRTKAADEKMRRTMEEAQRRSAESGDRSAAPGTTRGGRSWGGWRSVSQENVGEQPEDANESCAEEIMAPPAAEEAKLEEAVEEVLPGETLPNASKMEEPQAEATEHATAPQAAWNASAPVLPEAGGIWTPTANDVGAGGNQSKAWRTPWLSGEEPWNHGGLGTMLVTEQAAPPAVPPAAGTWVPRTSAPVAPPHAPVPTSSSNEVIDYESPSVIIPASYTALLGPGPEPAVKFGSFDVTSEAAVLPPPEQPRGTAEESAAVAEPEGEAPRQDTDAAAAEREAGQQRRPQRSAARPPRGEAWAPRIKAWEPRNEGTVTAEAAATAATTATSANTAESGGRPARGGGKGRGSGRGARNGEAAGQSPSDAPAPSSSVSAEDGKGDSKAEGKGGRTSKKGTGRAGGRKGTGKQYWTERKPGAAGK